jgi:hypothetical protein
MRKPSPAYFDYLGAAKACHLTEEEVAVLETIERQEFPDDQMMFELHMLRLIEQIRAGRIKLGEVLPGAG